MFPLSLLLLSLPLFLGRRPFFLEWTMRVLLFLTLALVGCANANHGKDPLNTSTTSNPVMVSGLTSDLAYSNCKTATLYLAGDTSFSTQVSGTSFCAGVTEKNSVKIKTTSRFPLNERFCVVPLHSTQGALPAACSTIDGQKVFHFLSANFDSVALVRESQLANYLNYLKGSASYPALAYANLR